MKLRARNAKMLASIAVLFGTGLANNALADTMTFGGIITQSTPDGTGPAVNNPSLNLISDGGSFLGTLTFTGSITAPGTYGLPGASLVSGHTAVGNAGGNFVASGPAGCVVPNNAAP